MARRKNWEIAPDKVRAEMLRGIRQSATVALYDACGKRLAAQDRWDIVSMRDVREICLLTDSVQELRTKTAEAIRAGDVRAARQYLGMRHEAEKLRGELMERWNLLPPKKRGRPAQETPEDLREAPADDGWDTFGMDTDDDDL